MRTIYYALEIYINYRSKRFWKPKDELPAYNARFRVFPNTIPSHNRQTNVRITKVKKRSYLFQYRDGSWIYQVFSRRKNSNA